MPRPVSPLLLLSLSPLVALSAEAGSYAVAVSDATYADPGWKKTTDALVAKHRARLVVHPFGKPAEARATLAKLRPEFTAFVARPDECGRAYCAEVFRTVRALDDDPYEDTVWGVVTGSDAAGALRRIENGGDVTIRTGLGTTGLTEARFEKLFFLGDGKAGEWMNMPAAGMITRGVGDPVPEAVRWANYFRDTKPDLIVTSGHGFENGVEMPFSRGMVVTSGGSLRILADLKAKNPPGTLPVLPADEHSRVWLAAGNCLAGHSRGPDSLAPVALTRYGVTQFVGFTVVSWYGVAGWGSLNLLLDGRHDITLADAVWLTRQNGLAKLGKLAPRALAYDPHYADDEKTDNDPAGFIRGAAEAGVYSETLKPGEGRDVSGLLWERDTFVMYGDPAITAKFPSASKPDAAKPDFVAVAPGLFRFTVRWPASASPDNLPPLGFRFPKKFAAAPIPTDGPPDLILADDFLLIPAPKPGADRTLSITLRAP